jgi:hypothetical protein
MSPADAVYILCALTSIACAVLLLRSYAQSKVRLLFWSGLAFSFFALNNILLVIDLTILSDTDLLFLRGVPSLVGLGVLLYGFIWEEAR